MYLTKLLYPWLKYILVNHPDLIGFLHFYTLIIRCTVVYWKLPSIRHYKYNFNEASKDNPSPCYSTFFIRDDECNLVYAESRRIRDTNNLMAELMVVIMG